MAKAFRISPFNLIEDFGYVEAWAEGDSVAPSGWRAAGTAGSIAKESTIVKRGSFSMKITSGASGVYAAELSFREYEADFNKYGGFTIRFGMWVKCDTTSKARIYIDDGVNRTDSSYHSGSDDWEFLEVEKQIDTVPTKLVFGAESTNNAVVAYFDGGTAVIGETIFTEFRDEPNGVYTRHEDWRPQTRVEISQFDIPRRDGLSIPSSKINTRVTAIDIQLHDADFETARGLYDDIMAAVSDGKKDLFLDDDRYERVLLSNIPRLLQAAEGKVYRVNMQFVAPEPFSKSVGFKRTKKVVTSSPDTFTVDYDGSYKGLPRFIFQQEGNALTNMTLENLTTGQQFSFDINVVDGGTLLIDSDKQILLNNAVDGISDMVGDFIELHKGTNNFRITASNTTLYVDYPERFL